MILHLFPPNKTAVSSFFLAVHHFLITILLVLLFSSSLPVSPHRSLKPIKRRHTDPDTYTPLSISLPFFPLSHIHAHAPSGSKPTSTLQETALRPPLTLLPLPLSLHPWISLYRTDTPLPSTPPHLPAHQSEKVSLDLKLHCHPQAPWLVTFTDTQVHTYMYTYVAFSQIHGFKEYICCLGGGKNKNNNIYTHTQICTVWSFYWIMMAENLGSQQFRVRQGAPAWGRSIVRWSNIIALIPTIQLLVIRRSYKRGASQTLQAGRSQSPSASCQSQTEIQAHLQGFGNTHENTSGLWVLNWCFFTTLFRCAARIAYGSDSGPFLYDLKCFVKLTWGTLFTKGRLVLGLLKW